MHDSCKFMPTTLGALAPLSPHADLLYPKRIQGGDDVDELLTDPPAPAERMPQI